MREVSIAQDLKPAMAAIALQFSYALVSILTRAALLEGMRPRVFVAYRQASATLFMVPVAYFCRKGRTNEASLGLKSFSLMFLAALIGVAINMNLYAEGLYLTSASVTTAASNLVPVVTFIVAVALGLEHVNIRSLRSIAKIVGTIFSVGGAILIALLKGPKLNNFKEHLILMGSMFAYGGGGLDNNWIFGCLCLLLNCCCWSIWHILQVPLCKLYPDFVSLSAWLCFISTLQSVAIALFFKSDLSSWTPTSNMQIGSVIFLGVVGSGICFFVQSWCIAQRGPVFCAMFTPLPTVLVTIFCVIFLHEELYTGSLAGAIAVVIGLYLVLWGKAKDTEPPGKSNDTTPKIDLEESLLLNTSPTINDIEEANGKD